MIHSALLFTAASVIHMELHSHGITHSLICMEMRQPRQAPHPGNSSLCSVRGREGASVTSLPAGDTEGKESSKGSLGRGDTAVPSSPAPRLLSLFPVCTGVLSLVSPMWSSRADGQKPNHPLSTGGVAGDGSLLPRQVFFFQNFLAGAENQVKIFH